MCGFMYFMLRETNDNHKLYVINHNMKKHLRVVVIGLLSRIFLLTALSFPTYALSEEISPRDVERYCEVYMYSERYGEIDC